MSNKQREVCLIKVDAKYKNIAVFDDKITNQAADAVVLCYSCFTVPSESNSCY